MLRSTYSSMSPNLGTTDLLFSSWFSLFWNVRIGIIQYTAFSDSVLYLVMVAVVNGVGFVISEDLSLGPSTRVDHSRALLKWKRTNKASDLDIRSGLESDPLASLRKRSYILFQLAITINQNNISSLWRPYQVHSHSIHFKIIRLVRRFSRRNSPQAGYIFVI